MTKARDLAELIGNSLIDGDEIATGAVGTSNLAATLDFSSKTMVMANDQLSGDKIHGGTISGFTSTGIDDNSTANVLTVVDGPKIGIGYNNPQDSIHVLGNAVTPNVGLTLQTNDTANAVASINLMSRVADNTNRTVSIKNILGRLDINANMDIHGLGTNFKSESYNILNLQTDSNDDQTSTDGIFKITNGSAATTKAEFRWDESEDLVHISYGDHGRHISIASNGNVGVGTGSTAPASPFHIQADDIAIRLDGTGNTSRKIFFRSTTNANKAEIYADGGLKIWTDDAGSDLLLAPAGSLLMATMPHVTINSATEYSTTETSELAPVATDALFLYNEEDTSTYGKVSILMRSAGGGGGASARITLKNERSGSGGLGFFFRDNGHTADQQEKMYLSSDGNLTVSGGYYGDVVDYYNGSSHHIASMKNETGVTTGSTWTTVKQWVASHSGQFTTTFAAYIQSGGSYYNYRFYNVTKGAVVKMSNNITDASHFYNANRTSYIGNVHQYSFYSLALGKVSKGDVINLQMVSASGGGVNQTGSGQTSYVKQWVITTDKVTSAERNNGVVIQPEVRGVALQYQQPNASGPVTHTIPIFLGSGTHNIFSILDGFDQGTMAVASVRYVGLYGYAGAGSALGDQMATIRRSNSNTAWQTGSHTVHYETNGGSVSTPSFAWTTGGVLQMILAGSVQIVGEIKITAHSVPGYKYGVAT